jgi:hypothetical protein
MDNVQKYNICTNVPSSQTFRSYFYVITYVSRMVNWKAFGRDRLWPDQDNDPGICLEGLRTIT